MKKNKLILLTILMVLVLYCGAVIFVTKPNSFAYESIFGNSSAPATPKTAQSSASAESVDTQALVAQAEAAAKEAASKSAEDARKAIEAAIPALVDEAVKKALSEYDISKQVADKVSQGIADSQEDMAEAIYGKYRDGLVEEVSRAVLERIEYENSLKVAAEAAKKVEEAAEAASEPKQEQPVAEPEVEENEPPKVITAEEYEAQRQEIRESEISSLLEKLGE